MKWEETPKASLRPALKFIIQSIEEAAPGLAAKLEEAERRAEIARQEWLAAQEKRRREEG